MVASGRLTVQEVPRALGMEEEEEEEEDAENPRASRGRPDRDTSEMAETLINRDILLSFRSIPAHLLSRVHMQEFNKSKEYEYQ